MDGWMDSWHGRQSDQALSENMAIILSGNDDDDSHDDGHDDDQQHDDDHSVDITGDDDDGMYSDGVKTMLQSLWPSSVDQHQPVAVLIGLTLSEMVVVVRVRMQGYGA